jgi:hypothetical protein
MMRGATVFLAFSVAIGHAGTLTADRSGLGDSALSVAGALEIQGEEVKAGIFRLQMMLQPLSGSPYALGALKVFAEPSHSLLFAAVDPARLGSSPTATIVAERPAARLEGSLEAGISPMVTFRLATTTDARVRIEYILLGPNGTRVSHTVRDVVVGSLSRFAFKTGPRLGPPEIRSSLAPAPIRRARPRQTVPASGSRCVVSIPPAGLGAVTIGARRKSPRSGDGDPDRARRWVSAP